MVHGKADNEKAAKGPGAESHGLELSRNLTGNKWKGQVFMKALAICANFSFL